MLLKRLLFLNKLLEQKSHFLFGARGVGKSTLIQDTVLNNNTLYFDLLDDDHFERLLRRPKIISEELTSDTKVVVIDEIQRLPKLLNEAHRLIEKNKGLKFLLTGSSARKLKKSGTNLLGGRAWEAKLFPLASKEIPDFDLVRYLNQGGLPSIYFSKSHHLELKNYVSLYLREEIFREGAIRKQEFFLSFLDIIALQSGQELAYESLSQESGVPARTIQNYVTILEDTLVGYQVLPFQTKIRKSIARSKFFLFDLGVTNYLAKRGQIKDGSKQFGDSFEHFVANELRAFLSYSQSEERMFYWRSTSKMEVDFILGNLIAIEVKASKQITEGHLKGLKALREEGMVKKFIVVSQDPESRKVDGISVVPIRKFLEKLWESKSVSELERSL